MTTEERKPVKVLVVDDSPFMRMALCRMLENNEEIQVVGTARNGLETLEKVRSLLPDVITLDVEMPRMNGLDTLRALMSSSHPIPCIMVSSLTTDGAEITLSSLDEGAVDFITKPSTLIGMDIAGLQKNLIDKILIASKVSPLSLRSRVVQRALPPPGPGHSVIAPQQRRREVEAVLIGISTGGPPALQQFIPMLPQDFPVAVVVAQHMPPGFTRSMAERLNGCSAIEVKESEEGDVIIPGRVLIARSGMHLTFKEKFGKKIAHITSKPEDEYYFPSVNVLFNSAAEVFGNRALPVVMTGMGSDGVQGLRALKMKNAFSIAQSEESCVVYGMPKAAIEGGLIDRIASLDEMAKAIMEEI